MTDVAPDEAEDSERAEIEADLRDQGLLTDDPDEAADPFNPWITVDQVRESFNLFERLSPEDVQPDYVGPAPAFGMDWRYEPQPGEESLFSLDEK